MCSILSPIGCLLVLFIFTILLFVLQITASVDSFGISSFHFVQHYQLQSISFVNVAIKIKIHVHDANWEANSTCQQVKELARIRRFF